MPSDQKRAEAAWERYKVRLPYATAKEIATAARDFFEGWAADRGGPAFPNPGSWRIASTGAGKGEVNCLHCDRPVAVGEVYRCLNCDGPFHKLCLSVHFGGTNGRAATDEERITHLEQQVEFWKFRAGVRHASTAPVLAEDPPPAVDHDLAVLRTTKEGDG